MLTWSCVRVCVVVGGAGAKYGALPGAVRRHARHTGSRGAAGLQREASDHIGVGRRRKGKVPLIDSPVEEKKQNTKGT